EAVLHANVPCGNDIGLTVQQEADVANQSFVENCVYGCFVVNTAFGQAFDSGSAGNWKLVHSTNLIPSYPSAEDLASRTISTNTALASSLFPTSRRNATRRP